MSKKITAGAEVDAWCTKCKLDLNHRIIAMEGDAIKRVECLTCRGHHNYRRPKSADPPAKAKKKRATAASTRKARVTAAQEAHQTWEKAIMGRSPSAFTAYRISERFKAGQLLRHKKFGDGVVAAVMEDGKVSVLFEDGAKTLVHGR
jgi:Zn ribbon nucleic-acid-binding protein